MTFALRYFSLILYHHTAPPSHEQFINVWLINTFLQLDGSILLLSDNRAIHIFLHHHLFFFKERKGNFFVVDTGRYPSRSARREDPGQKASWPRVLYIVMYIRR